MVCEGGALGWGGVFLHDSKGASLSLAATAVTAYTAGQTTGRLMGDRLSLRYGPGRAFRAGGFVAAGGLTLAVLAPAPTVAVAGFAVMGLGTSVLLPLTFSAIGRVAEQAAAVVSRFTTFTYAGILLGPGLIGWASDLAGLTWTIAALIPVLLTVTLARAVR
jgi:MFS family permease